VIRLEDEVFYELGVDIDNNYTFNDGDLKLSFYDDNLVQAISNRLNTQLNELSLFYTDYGSVFASFFGWRATDETLNFMKAELETVLEAEERVNDWEIDINYNGDGKVQIDLDLYPNADYSISASLIVGDSGDIEVVE